MAAIGKGIVTLEMAAVIEFWDFRADGSVVILLTEAVRCWRCDALHYWYVNRDGRTKCIDCDSGCRSESQRTPSMENKELKPWPFEVRR